MGEIMSEIPTFIQISGFFLALGGYTWGVISYIMKTIDDRVSSERKERLRVEGDLYNKIDLSKENSVRREDFNRHVDSVEKQFTSFREDLKTSMSTINSQLNNLILLMTSSNTKKDK